jgi:putative ABC transport system ATP-binding protein
MAVIAAAEGLRKGHGRGAGRVEVLREVSLHVEEGEYLALMGPSGSGKSTLLALLGCLDRPDEGGYVLAGVETRDASEGTLAALRNRILGFVFQGFQLVPSLTAEENVALPLLYAGWARSRRLERAKDLLGNAGLADRGRHRPAELSGGEQQRVAICRALAASPRLVLADEPTGSLDSATSGRILELLDALHRAEGVALVVVTHDPSVAARAGRIVRIHDGTLVG